MTTIRGKISRSHTQNGSTTGPTFWKGRVLKYVGLFLLFGSPLTLAAWQGATSEQSTKLPKDNVSVKQPSAEVQLMKPNQSQNQSGNSSSSHVRVETNVHSSTSAGTSSNQQSVSGSTSTNQNSSSTSVTINGQDVPMPRGGTLHKTFTAPDGSKSSVDISVGGEGDNVRSSSSVQVQVEGSSND